MCLTWVLVPHRLPHGAGCMWRAVVVSVGSTVPWSLRLRLLELLEHVGGTQLLATVHQLPVTHGDRQGLTSEGGRRAVVSSRPEIGGFRGIRKWRELPPCPVLVQLRAGRQAGDPGRENSLPP